MARPTDQELLRQAAAALLNVSRAAVCVKPHLDQPYLDAPNLTPWTEIMDRPAMAALKLGQRIRKHLEQGEKC